MEKKKRVLAAAIGLAIAVGGMAGCSATSAESDFVVAVRESLDTGFSDAELVGVARDACAAVADGGGQQALQRLLIASGLSAYDYGVVAGYGVTHLCPDQTDAFNAILNG